MKKFKFFRGITEKTPVEIPIENDNTIWNLDMDKCLIAVIKYKISKNEPLLVGDVDLREVNFPVNNCYLRVNRSNNWGSDNIEMVDIDYQLIESYPSNCSYNFTYRSEVSVLMNRLTYENV